MAKVRVYELAKEFRVESKIIMRRLAEMGEHVRSASSVIDAPIAKRLAADFEHNPELYKNEPTVYELAGRLNVSAEAILSTLTEWGQGAYSEHSTLDTQMVNQLSAAHRHKSLTVKPPPHRSIPAVSYAVLDQQQVLLVNSENPCLKVVKRLLDGLGFQTVTADLYEVTSGNIRLNSISCMILLFRLDSKMDHQDVYEVSALQNRPPAILLGDPYSIAIRQVAEACKFEDVVGVNELDENGALLRKSIQYAISLREGRRLKNGLDKSRSGRQENTMRGRLPDRGKSSVILMGAARYKDPALHELPAVRNNLTQLASALSDPRFGGFAGDRVHTILNPELNDGGVISQIAEQTQDALLFYFSGHGLLEADGEFFLALRESRAMKPRFSAFPYQWIRSMMLESPARSRIVILDCCFAGRAMEAMADQSSALVGQLDVAGAYTLAATAPNRTARAPKNHRYTAFSGELIRILSSGVANAGRCLGSPIFMRR